MKTRTTDSITVGFRKISEGIDQFSYFVEATGQVKQSCSNNVAECTVSNLSPGRQYQIKVTACIKGTNVCSDASNAAAIRTLPEGKAV